MSGQISKKELDSNLNALIDKLGNNTSNVTIDSIYESINNSTNKIMKNIDYSISNMINSLTGEGGSYGLGTLGDVTIDDDFLYTSSTINGRLVYFFKNLTIPEGAVFQANVENAGVYIYCDGNLTINGTLRGSELLYGNHTIDQNTGKITIPSDLSSNVDYIKIGNTNYKLAKGGNSDRFGIGGDSGSISWHPYKPTVYNTQTNITSGNYIFDNMDHDGNCYLPSVVTKNDTVYGIEGNHMFGGFSGNVRGDCYTVDCKGSSYSYYINPTIARSRTTMAFPAVKGYYQLPSKIKTRTALVLIVSGDVIIGENGLIDQSAVNEVAAGNGTYWSASTYSSAHGGSGPISPSGGGPLTIICNNLINNGKITTSGKSVNIPSGEYGPFRYTDQTSSDSGKVPSSASYGSYSGSAGGYGGIFTSTAGEIKIYELGNEVE